MDAEYLMNLALKQALRARAAGEVPIGCVIEEEGEILARAYNLREKRGSPLAHAEILAIERAARKRERNWRFNRATLVVTLEPCAMCFGAVLNGRFKRIIFGAAEPRTGCVGSRLDLQNYFSVYPKVEVISGVLEKECRELIQRFFSDRRSVAKKL